MPNELSIQAVAASMGPNENPAEPQTQSFTPPAHAPPAQSASPNPNPQLRLDPALGLVVIEFRDASGTITTSIPSQRQLDAYRIWQQGHSDPTNPSETLPLATIGSALGGSTGAMTAPQPAATEQPAMPAVVTDPSTVSKD